MKIIVPCAGKSSRFPNMRPKYMLNAPNGNLMVKEALSGFINSINPEDIVITILKEHEEKYNIIQGIERCFGFMPAICILSEPTKSQSETVYNTLKQMNITESFLVKDSDNFFSTDICDEEYNYICAFDLNNSAVINPSNKSYMQIDSDGKIVKFIEKKVISNLFSVGGYYFKSPEEFCKAYLALQSFSGELYLSNVISHMIENGEVFMPKSVASYFDWGTIDEWKKYTKQFKVYFIDIDGVIFHNSAQYFSPIWGETEPIERNVNVIKALKAKGNQIILTTSRTEEFRKITETTLEENGIKYDFLLMGCMHGQRILVNDYSKSNPYPSAVAINIPRDSDFLENFIEV
ncbi:MAG: hypothetical protein LBM93_12280 [Oscillospiraceae bacterium]|jgi:dTDP-glucose pyrophosphorylase|nr:hypothetical protein [Oscillospiraceae bacterium]